MVDTDKQLVVEPYSGPNRPTIGDYNPNIAWGRQIVEVELRQWKYSARFSVAVGGNCHGLDVLECAISMLYGELPASKDGVPHVTLLNQEGETLVCEDEDDMGDDWLKKMVVGCRVVDYLPPTVNDVRKMNGAKPVADGDRPYIPLS